MRHPLPYGRGSESPLSRLPSSMSRSQDGPRKEGGHTAVVRQKRQAKAPALLCPHGLSSRKNPRHSKSRKLPSLRSTMR